MLNFKKLDMNLSLQSVRKVIVERVSQDTINQLLYQLEKPVLLELVNVVDLDLELLEFLRDQTVSCLQICQVFLQSNNTVIRPVELLVRLLQLFTQKFRRPRIAAPGRRDIIVGVDLGQGVHRSTAVYGFCFLLHLGKSFTYTVEPLQDNIIVKSWFACHMGQLCGHHGVVAVFAVISQLLSF
jgi:hypothetical protein